LRNLTLSGYVAVRAARRLQLDAVSSSCDVVKAEGVEAEVDSLEGVMEEVATLLQRASATEARLALLTAERVPQWAQAEGEAVAGAAAAGLGTSWSELLEEADAAHEAQLAELKDVASRFDALFQDESDYQADITETANAAAEQAANAEVR
jgi:hypothetical protein